MLRKVFDALVRFAGNLNCNIKCCSSTVKVSSPKKQRYKPRSPVRKQRTI